MRVHPDLLTAPLLTMVMSSSGAASAACKTHINPAPPLPTTATSVSIKGMLSSSTLFSLPAASGAAVDVVAAVYPVSGGDRFQALGAGRVAAVGDQDHGPVQGCGT